MGVCEPCCFARDGWLFLWGRRLMMVPGSGRSPGFTEPFFVLAHPSPVCKHVVWEFMLGACNRYFLHQGRAILARQGTAGSLHSFAVHCFPLSRTILQEMTSTLRQEIGRVLADAMQLWQDVPHTHAGEHSIRCACHRGRQKVCACKSWGLAGRHLGHARGGKSPGGQACFTRAPRKRLFLMRTLHFSAANGL